MSNAEHPSWTVAQTEAMLTRQGIKWTRLEEWEEAFLRGYEEGWEAAGGDPRDARLNKLIPKALDDEAPRLETRRSLHKNPHQSAYDIVKAERDAAEKIDSKGSDSK